MSKFTRLKSNTIKVKLVGGLGNQLFGYFAGLNLAKTKNAELILDVTDVRNKLGVHNVSIESLNLKGTFISKKIVKHPCLRIKNKLIYFFKKFSFFSLDYFSDVIGYDERIFGLPKGCTLHGYFQTYKYFISLNFKTTEITLRNPSNWFLQKSQEITKNDVLVIHVRRGDYEKYAHKYGLLSSEFYKKAIEKAESLRSYLQIWVFSDDIAKAKQLLDRYVPANTVWVDPNDVEDDAEALLLMSKARTFIIANSTFSWWAAMLSQNDSIVIAPKKWYQNMTDPNELIPLNWITLESVWE